MINQFFQELEALEINSEMEDKESIETWQTGSKSNLMPEEVVLLLAKLPPKSKKVLAMYYHENMPPFEIATYLGVTEAEICQIHAQSVEFLQIKCLWPGVDGAEKDVSSLNEMTL